jgi:four helix bundle protein
MPRIQGDLCERTCRFALSVLNVVDALPSNIKGWELGKQLIRSGISVGANVREADHALTVAEFAHRANIARKEAFESSYWLRLCTDSRLLKSRQTDGLMADADELVRVLSTIVKKTQMHLKRPD